MHDQKNDDNSKLCFGKKCWSKGRVLKVKKAVMTARNRKVRAYECSDCGYWHLTSKSEYWEKK